MDEEKKLEDSLQEDQSVEEEKQEDYWKEMEDDKDKKIKNLVSAVILLAGLFVGSLFVDIVQLVRGGGFSQRALSATDVFSSSGKTWVAYTDPIVKVQVLNDETCGDACKPDEVLVGLKQALPTMLSTKVDVNSFAGKKLIAEFSIKTLPAFIFSSEIEKTDLFAKAQPFMDKQADGYLIRSAEAGFPVGKYISAPIISEKDIKVGSDDATVKVVMFSFFQNPGDKQFYQTIVTPMIKEYGEKIQFVFKNYFPPTAPQAPVIAMAAQCANAQGKFLPYADKLFAAQDSLSKLKDASGTLKSYATVLGLNALEFNKCLDSKQFKDQTDTTLKEGQGFAIQATPSMFVGTDLQAPTVKYEDVKKAIDAQLTK